MVVPQNLTLQEQTAVAVLIEEIQKRTQLRLAVQTAMPPAARRRLSWEHPPNLAELRSGFEPNDGRAAPATKAFRVQVVGGNVVVAGNDARGMLFGVGILLRATCAWSAGRVLGLEDKLRRRLRRV